MKPRIAISAPMSVPMVHLCEVEDLLNEKFHIPYSHISFWDRKSQYDQNLFDSADAIVFILPNFSFDSTKVKLGYEVPIGVRSELNLAIKQQKKICIAYKTANTGINIYNVSWTVGRIPKDYTIKGIAGTSHEFGEWVDNFACHYKTLDRWKKAGLLENTDPIEQVALPIVKRVYAKMVPNPDYLDERLLFLL